jgi:acetyl esterase/lipase
MVRFVFRFAAFASAVLAGCSTQEAFDGPTEDVCYVDRGSDGESCVTTLDIYLPDEDVKDAPVMMMVHGGGWESGDKKDTAVTENQAPWFTSQGWIYVSINYRLAPDVKVDAMAGDVAAAVGWLRSNIRNYGGDPDEISLMGHEAGAHLAALATLDQSYFEAEGVTGDKPVQSLSLYNGVAYDIAAVLESTEDEALRRQITQAVGDDRAAQAEASPITHVGGQEWVPWQDAGTTAGRTVLPFLLQFVPENPDASRQAAALEAGLDSSGWVVRSWEADETDETIVADVGRFNEPVTQVQLDFLRAVQGAWVYSEDLVFGVPDEHGNVIQATEVDHIVTFQGKLYAGLGNWNEKAFIEDLQLPLPDEVAAMPPGAFGFYGAMMVVKEGPNAPWKLDHYFGTATLRVDALETLVLTTDENGAPLPEPFEILYAGVTAINLRTAGVYVHWKDPNTGEWGTELLDQDFLVPPGGAGATDLPFAPYVRSFWTAVNSVNGVHEAFAGPATGKIYRGVYDPSAPGYIRWDDEPEFDVGDREDIPFGRPLTALTVNGQNLVGLGARVFRRDDATRTWVEILEVETDDPSNDPRAFATVPAVEGDGDEFLVAIRADGAMLRVDNRSDPVAQVEEIKVRELFDTEYGPTMPRGCPSFFSAYNDIEPHVDLETGRMQHLTGTWTDCFPHPYELSRAPWNGTFLLVRDLESRSYDLSLIYDYEAARPACATGCNLRGARYFTKSPFPDHEGRVFYTGGFDANILNRDDFETNFRNTAWLYRADWSKDVGY